MSLVFYQNKKCRHTRIVEKMSLKIALYTAMCVGLLSVKNAELLGYAPILSNFGNQK